MRPDVFEALAPVCPRCLHGGAGEAPLRIGHAAETRAGRLWHGILHCSSSACWTEFPVIDGVPVVVPDPAGFLQNARAQVLARETLPGALESLLGDALGPGGEFDTTRQHLSIYAGAHYADWGGIGSDRIEPLVSRHSRESGNLVPVEGDPRLRGDDGEAEASPSDRTPPWAGDETPDIVGALRAGRDALGAVEGPAIDIGGSVGRGGWELSRSARPVLTADLNFSFLRFAQRLALDGEATFGHRRVGLVYDPVTVRLPPGMGGAHLDFWAADAMALPFRAGAFRLATAINLVDSIAGPTEMVAEAARVLAPGGGAVFATPHDWSQNAAEPARWMGGHSQRGPLGGAAEPVLTATLAQHGLAPVAERTGLPWRLRLHDRAVMHYDLHLVACRRTG
ncbi:MAG TPA: methyltransferase domain-containing protein [Paracoccaceae bacterium]|nr:methyltransferase domain-containing protein [Paracoccaceae bacterium]